MALTQAQREAHYGRFLRLVVQVAATPTQQAQLADLVRLLAPAARRYVLSDTGTLGTPAERREAMDSLRQLAYQALTGLDATTDAAAHHRAIAHEWQGEEPS